MANPEAGFNAVGAPVTRGVCSVCGTKMNRMGKTPAHEGLPVPEKKKRVSRKKKKGKLVIVESPAKARTVGRYLGKGYTVKASVGHVRDLLRSSLSVDLENNFEPKYRVPNEKRDVVKELTKAAKEAEEIYLATDPDREGEAIAWHLLEAAKMDEEITKRVVFHEITKGAIEEAFGHPREVDMGLVDAQQARRVLDRLVGYSLSPLLWQKVRGRLSAGRVQSVALRLIVEREREVEDFIPEEYWSIHAEFKQQHAPEEPSFTAKLARVDGEDASLPNEETTSAIVSDMEQAAYEVTKVKRGERRRKPSAPFTTSTLQQDASRQLGFTAKKTMRVAQQLYEGIDIGEGAETGLITYMRTDSVNISEVAQSEAREFILGKYGDPYLPETPPKYQTKAKAAQEAHEAIRCTSVLRTPKSIKDHLTRDQFKLYRLIWQRFVASQMAPAVFDTISVEITGKSEHEYLLRASGSSQKFAGFLVVYEESKDEDARDATEDVAIPGSIAEQQLLDLLRLMPEQHFTQPPPRYTEATLVRTLEEFGIGRPSTYAPTLSTIQSRGYVTREKKRLLPTETGVLVNDLLVQYFSDVIGYNFTAHMEEDLDEVAEGKRGWQEVVGEFYQKFEPELKHAQEEIPVAKAEPEKIGRECPNCGHDLVIRWGRFGKFISCSNFPECRYTEPWLESIGVHCPDCADGDVVLRRSRKGRIFYGCSNFPECQFTSWKRPLAAPCPSCGGTLVVANKREAACLKCEETFLLEQFETAEEDSAD
ncbi:MAG: type I DNA topoisomerase [Anaerolineaceae bacterium]|nr:type I DNA topoisomerase [Anaerolineaceae bacterium]